MSKSADGILVLDKPAGPTSHDVVARVRRLTRTKVGHTGTLDPAATGVLPLALGRATRLTRFIQAVDKEYLATIRLGVETDTYDAEGAVVDRKPVPELQEDEVQACLRPFIGEIDQVPPMYSAIKIAGERLYKAARRQEIVERPSRRVVVFNLELLERSRDTFRLRIHCSSGTYIRSLAHDLGILLQCGAHLEELRRTRTGEFSLEQSLHLEDVEEHWEERLIPLEQLLPEFLRVNLSPPDAIRVRNGNPVSLPPQLDPNPGTVVRLFDEGQFVAVAEISDLELKPCVVLRPKE